MNSNTHNQTFDNSPLSTPSIPASTHLDLLPSKIYNPTTADVERLSRQYAQYFSMFQTNNEFTQDHQLKTSSQY